MSQDLVLDLKLESWILAIFCSFSFFKFREKNKYDRRLKHICYCIYRNCGFLMIFPKVFLL
jgi:hypothetical protein